MQRALLLEPDFYGVESMARLEAAHVAFDALVCASHEQLHLILENARKNGQPYNALFVRLGLSIDTEIFAAGSPELQWVVTPTTGLDHIDLRAARERNVRVLSLKGCLDFLREVSSTAEMTWALLLALLRKIPTAHQHVLDGNWNRSPYLGRELRGMKLGVWGLGRLGTMTAGYGRAFGMEVLACDDRDEPFTEMANAHVVRCELEDLLTRSDIVTLHLPLSERNNGILNQKRLAMLRSSSYLINTARGELVDETALLEALSSRRIAGCAIDVMRGDSRWCDVVPEDHPLVSYARSNDNLIITPHIGGYTTDAVAKTRHFMIERFCEDLTWKNNE